MIRQYLTPATTGRDAVIRKAKELAGKGYQVLSIECTSIPWEGRSVTPTWQTARTIPGFKITIDTNGDPRESTFVVEPRIKL